MKMMKTYKRLDLNFEKGEGVFLYEKNGDKYLDFVAGIAVNSLGHSHPQMVAAIQEQAAKMIHISNLYYHDSQLSLADKMIALSDHSSVFFCNSGTEAVEGALKVARKYGFEKGKQKILYMNNSFHGRTMGALAVTGQEKYQKSFKPLIGDVAPVVFNDLEDFNAKMDESVCGVILEPIQGEGGINPVDPAFLKGIKAACEQYDALLIFDEVQAGIGRTGSFYAYQQFDVVPDVVAMAKGLGGGVPIGAFMVNEKAESLTYGDHGCTFGGNPLVTASANVVLDIVGQTSFLEEVAAKGAYLKSALEKLAEEVSFIKKVKGTGLMIGLDIDIEKVPLATLTGKALENKLLIISAGTQTIRLVPPLTITTEEIDLFLDLFSKTCKSL